MNDGFMTNLPSVSFDENFQRAIGGYPRKAWVRDEETGRVYRSLVDDNVRPLSDALAWSRVAG